MSLTLYLNNYFKLSNVNFIYIILLFKVLILYIQVEVNDLVYKKIKYFLQYF